MKALKLIIVLLFAITLKASGVNSENKGLEIRDGLPNFFYKIQNQRSLNIVYFGGSITAAGDGWRELSCNWLRVRYPEVIFSQINSSIGGTGSVLGVFRADNDIIKHKPDLVFIEFAVNDGGRAETDEIKTIEGIVRKIWANLPETDICFVYTTDENKFNGILEGKTDSAILAMEKIANHYGIPSINFAPRLEGLYRQGKLTFTGTTDQNSETIVFTTDKVHPLSRSGHPLYAASVADGLESMKAIAEHSPHALPSSMIEDNWQKAKLVNLTDTKMKGWELVTNGPLYESYHSAMPIIYKGNPNSSINFRFKGTVLGLYDFLGPKSGKINVTIDGDDYEFARFDRHCSYMRRANIILAENLEDKTHDVRITVSPDKIDKEKILYSTHLEKFKENPAMFDGIEYYIGNILMVGELVKEDNSMLEGNLFFADKLWAKGKLEDAARLYVDIIESNRFPEPVIKYSTLLKLAELNIQKRDFGSAEAIVNQLETEDLPVYQRMLLDKIKQESFKTGVDTCIKTTANKYVAQLYVKQGYSNGDGTLDHPFGSIRDAVQKASSLSHDGTISTGPIAVSICGTEYLVNQSEKLDSSCSGTERNPIVITSLCEESPVSITGHIVIDNWKVESDPTILQHIPESSRGKIVVSDMTDYIPSGIPSLQFGGFGSGRSNCGTYRFDTMPIPELYYDGKVQEYSRWPDMRDTVATINRPVDKRVDMWNGESDVWLHGYWKYLYADSYEKVGGTENGKINLVPPYNRYGFSDETKGLITESRWYGLNILSEMNREGEWKYSSADNKIWFFPPAKFKKALCVLSYYGPGFLLSNCDWITFSNLNIHFIKGDGIVANECNHLSFKDCTISKLSGLGIQILGGSGHILSGLTIDCMGRGGIYLQSGDKNSLKPSESVVDNCHISNLSRIDRTYTPAVLLDGVGITVQHCLFENIPSSAIRLEGNDHLIQYNEFKDCVLESNDQGAIDIWFNSLFRGNVIRWNYFHDIGSPERMAGAVRMDDAISGVAVFENIMVKSSSGDFGAIQIHGGNYNYLDGNIIIDCQHGISQTAWPDEFWDRHFKNLKTISAMKERALNDSNWGKYPEMKEYLSGNPNRNIIIDNCFINCEDMIFKNSGTAANNKIDRLVLMNNKELKEKLPPSLDKIASKYCNPAHVIPVNEIGLRK